jgi:hypothetical protein
MLIVSSVTITNFIQDGFEIPAEDGGEVPEEETF